MLRNKRYCVDLLSHMAECDANFARLMKLMPGFAERDLHVFNLVIAEHTARVSLRVVERCPYTTWVELLQHPVVSGLEFELPALRVLIRLYHDARNAEVVEFQESSRFRSTYPYPNPEMRHRDEKVQVNRFLGEYLAACLAHGTATEPASVFASP
jgi:uncharacterized protein